MSDTPSNPPSGSDIVNLGVSFSANGADETLKKTEQVTEGYIKAADALDKLGDTENKRATNSKAKQQWQEAINAVNSYNKGIAEAEKIQRQMAAAQDAAINKKQAFIVKVNELARTFGLSREAILRYRAQQQGLLAELGPLIDKMEQLRQAKERTSIQQRRDVESHNEKAKALRQEAKEYEALAKQMDKYYAEQRKSAEKYFAEENKRIAEQEKAKSRQAKDAERYFNEENQRLRRQQQIQERRDVEMMRMRERSFRAEEAARIRSDKEKAASAERAIKYAERETMEKIRWGEMNVRQQVNQLERLQKAKEMGMSDKSLGRMFGAGALGAVGDLPGMRKQAEVFDVINGSARRASFGVGMFRGSLLNLGAAFSAVEMVSMIDQYTKFTAQLKLATDSSEDYAAALKDVQRIARTSEMGLAQTGVLYARIARSTEQLGITQQRVSDITETVNMALKASGATTKEAASAMLQLSQAFGSGVLRGEEFNAVNEAAPALMQAIADGLGVSKGALKEMSKEGMITAEIMAITIPKALERMRADAMQVRTVSGAFQVLKDSVMEYIGKAAEATGFTKALTDTIKFLADNIDIVLTGVTTLVGVGLAAWLNLGALGFTGIAAKAGIAAIAVKGFFAAMGPIGWAITALGLGATAWQLFGKSAKEESERAASATDNSTKSIIADINEQIKKLKERNDLMEFGVGKLPKQIDEASLKVNRLRAEYQDAVSGTGGYAAMPAEARQIKAQNLGREYGEAYAALQKLNGERERGTRVTFEKNKAEVMAQYATEAERLNKALKEAKTKLGLGDDQALPADVEKRIRDSFAKKNKGPKDPAIAAEKKEQTLYKSLIAQINEKIEANKLELAQEAKLTEAQSLRIKIEEQLESGAKILGAARVKAIRALLDQLDAEEKRVAAMKERKKFEEEEAKRKEKEAREMAEAAEAIEKETQATLKRVEILRLGKAAAEAMEARRVQERIDNKIALGQYDAELDMLQRIKKARDDNSKALAEEAMLKDLGKREKKLYKFLGKEDKFGSSLDDEVGENSDKVDKSKYQDMADSANTAAEALKALYNVEEAEKFGTTLIGIFTRVGETIDDLTKAVHKYGKIETEIAEQRQTANDLYMEGRIDSQKLDEINIDLSKKESQAKLASYADMASAAKGFFGEQTAAYKTLDGLSKAFHMAQIAMNLYEMGQLAVKAVLKQGEGDPYTAWARMAAMAAAVAALGFAVGGGFSGGAQQSGRSAEERQKSTGTGTVFGDPTAKTQSIANSIEILADNSELGMSVSRAMLRSLRNIEDGIGGLANAVIRSVGITSGNGFNISTGSGGNWLTGYNYSKIIDSGLQMDGGLTFRDYIQGIGVKQYAEKESYDSGFLGFGGGYDYETYVKDADPKVKEEIAKLFTSIVSTVGGLSETFGYDKQRTENFMMDDVTWTQGILSLRGLKGDELKEAMNSFFGSYMDQISELAIPGLDDFRKAGEGYLETAVRVANGIEKADLALEKYGFTAEHFTALANKQSDVGAEIFRETIQRYEGASSGIAKIIEEMDGSVDDLAAMYDELIGIRRLLKGVGLTSNVTADMIVGAGGDPSQLASALEGYADTYFSEEEKLGMMRKNLDEDMRKLGFSVPKTREDFRKLVESIDTSSASGQKLLGKLLMLADDFDSVTEAAEELAEAWKSVTDTILDEVKRIRETMGGEEENFAKLQADFAIATGKARAGDLEAAGELPELSKALLAVAEKTANSAEELAWIKAVTASSLEETAKLTKTLGELAASGKEVAEPRPFPSTSMSTTGAIWKDDGINGKSGSWWGMVRGFADGGTHMGGYRIVGEEGPELEMTGPSRILNGSQLSGMLNGELVQEVRALRQEVGRLRQENNAANESIARSAEKTHKILHRNDTPNGLLMTDTLTGTPTA